MTQKKNYWTYCKDCDTYHTFEEIPCANSLGKDIPQLPALPEGEKSAPLWTPDMKVQPRATSWNGFWPCNWKSRSERERQMVASTGEL